MAEFKAQRALKEQLKSEDPRWCERVIGQVVESLAALATSSKWHSVKETFAMRLRKQGVEESSMARK